MTSSGSTWNYIPPSDASGVSRWSFTYASGRSGKHAVDILKGFDGILQVDGYIGYNRVIEPIMFRHVAPNE